MVWFAAAECGAQERGTGVFDLDLLKSGMWIEGPAIILNKTSTILVEPDCKAEIDDFGNVIIHVQEGAG
jgi:5-oxoprolinase (ATP-hydrolysing)